MAGAKIAKKSSSKVNQTRKSTTRKPSTAGAAPAAKKLVKRARKQAAKKALVAPAAPQKQSTRRRAAETEKATKPAKPKKKAAGDVTGKAAPAFELVDQNGDSVSSKQLAGKPYVLYFYPRDNTPGCTKEACAFRDVHTAFRKLGVKVLGVSADSASSHAGFARKYNLPFTLLADPDKQLIEAYGVWVMKQNYGRQYMGIERSTFLVDAKGKVASAWRSIKVNGHVEAVLEQARALR